MIVVAVYILAVLLFSLTFHFLKTVQTCRHVFDTGYNTITTFCDKKLDDLAKEKAIQKLALSMMKQCLRLCTKVSIIFFVTALFIWIVNFMKLVTLRDLSEFAMRWDVFIITIIVALLSVVFLRFAKYLFSNRYIQIVNNTHYSKIDRGIHNLAFRSGTLLHVLNDFEHTFLSKTWDGIKTEQPIFITSLPRAGTTIILKALCRIPGLATHTYRDMPFILTPVLWNKFSKKFNIQGMQRERAHGDGLSISVDSPEAFEEVLWKKYFTRKYTNRYIMLWETVDDTFFNFFQEHIKKILSLRQFENIVNRRYISKNNANISRIRILKMMFPDAFIIVPLRNPVEQSISLWRQHHNFIKLHANDHFSQKYMGDIGHYEFGALHRPFQFPNFESLTKGLKPKSVDYWLAYWISAFQYLSEQEGISLLCYEKLCHTGSAGFATLCNHLKLTVTEDQVYKGASILHEPPDSRKSEHSTDEYLTKSAMGLYSLLQRRCLLNESID
jgi:hypothetical protein